MSVGKLKRYGLPFANVVASGIATNNVTPGRTLENLGLKLGGTTLTKAMLSSVKIKANGKTIITGTGTQLEALNAYRGENTDVAYLNIPFADYSLRDDFSRLVGAFDTSIGIANITSEVTIAGATAPQLTAILDESAAQKARDGNAAPFAPVLSKILEYPFSVATGGQLPVTVPFGPQNGAIIKRLHVFHNNHMANAVVKEDGITVHESAEAENIADQERMGRVPQSNVYTIDFCLSGNVKDALDTRNARSLEWLFTFDAADSGTILVEYLDVLGNL